MKVKGNVWTSTNFDCVNSIQSAEVGKIKKFTNTKINFSISFGIFSIDYIDWYGCESIIFIRFSLLNLKCQTFSHILQFRNYMYLLYCITGPVPTYSTIINKIKWFLSCDCIILSHVYKKKTVIFGLSGSKNVEAGLRSQISIIYMIFQQINLLILFNKFIIGNYMLLSLLKQEMLLREPSSVSNNTKPIFYWLIKLQFEIQTGALIWDMVWVIFITPIVNQISSRFI